MTIANAERQAGLTPATKRARAVPHSGLDFAQTVEVAICAGDIAARCDLFAIGLESSRRQICTRDGRTDSTARTFKVQGNHCSGATRPDCLLGSDGPRKALNTLESTPAHIQAYLLVGGIGTARLSRHGLTYPGAGAPDVCLSNNQAWLSANARMTGCRPAKTKRGFPKVYLDDMM